METLSREIIWCGNQHPTELKKTSAEYLVFVILLTTGLDCTYRLALFQAHVSKEFQMSRRKIAVLRGLTLLALVVATSLPTELVAAIKNSPTFTKPIKNPKFDPSAEQVDLFEAVDAGQVTIRLIPKNAMGGNVLIENKTDKPLTVKIPEAVAGVSIHSQFGNFGAGNLGLGNQGPGNNAAMGNGQNGQQQLGGGIGPAQGNGQAFGNGQGNNAQGVGQGFFSIPAEMVISLNFNSVCLEHGKPEPGPNSKYTLAPISKISRDPVLYQLLKVVRSGKVDTKAAQAAAWHQASKMSFQQLSEKMNTPLGALTQTPDFTRSQILAAEELIAQAKQKAAKASFVETSESKVKPENKGNRPIRLVKN